MATVACSRSFTAANDTTAAAELIPDAPGVQIRRIMTQINCMVTVVDGKVSVTKIFLRVVVKVCDFCLKTVITMVLIR